jgi:multicomponent Na+:H+ antiporter subunit A
MPMLTALLVAFAAALAAPWLTVRLGRSVGWVLALLPAGLTAFFLSLGPRVAAGEPLVQRVSWVPQLGVELAFRVDGLSLLFGLLIAGIGTFVAIYAGGYLAGDRQLPRFYLLLFAFMAAMLGVVTSDDLILLFVFWELTSITSFFLIGYQHESEESRANALQGLFVTAGGGLAMLAGFVLLGSMAGTYRISELLAAPAVLVEHPAYPLALALVALGAFTKSAQWPFHFWLPNAMAAPTPVSSYLHSATMVKAGVYLLARLAPGLGGTPEWFWLLTLVGGATVLAATGLTLLQRDSKRLLAYSTIVALGTMVLLIGVGTDAAIKAMVVFLFAHALYKAPLFMAAGSVDHEAGTRDVTRLAGLGRSMPWTWLAAGLAGISAAGLPPMLGFIGKELAYEGLLSTPWLLAGLIVAGAVLLWVAVMVAWTPFAGRTVQAPKAPHEAPPSMLVGPLALAALGLTFGLAPGLVQDGLMRPAAAAVLGAPYAFDLYLWHGLTLALGLSLLTVSLGVVLSATWRRWQPALVAGFAGVRFGPVAAYQGAWRGLLRFAELQTRFVQPDDLRHQLTTIVAFTVALTGGVALWRGGLDSMVWAPGGAYLHEFLYFAVILLATATVVRSHSRLVVITSLGVVGFGVAFVFVLFAAPDLAITQFLVDTLVVIIAALVLIRLPSSALRAEGGRDTRWMSGAIAIAGGALITGLLLAVTSLPFDRSLTHFFEANSYPVARGRNIVNVILVDFRAVDTLAEVVVLAIAAGGVGALMRRRLVGRDARAARREPEGGRR